MFQNHDKLAHRKVKEEFDYEKKFKNYCFMRLYIFTWHDF